MDVLAKAQSLVVEHAFTIGIGLLVTVLIAAFVWFSMSRSGAKSPVLENESRLNEATTAPQEQMPTQEQLEEMAKYRAESQPQQGDNTENE
jgi:hypothetical protein